MAKATTRKPATATKPRSSAVKTVATGVGAPKGASTTKPQTRVAAAGKTAPKPVVVKDTQPTVSDPAMKKKELIETVTERSGVKKRDAKPVVEAMLAVLGEALAEGRELNLQPLGKTKLNRAKDVQGGRVLIVKMRQSNRTPSDNKDPLAKAAE